MKVLNYIVILLMLTVTAAAIAPQKYVLPSSVQVMSCSRYVMMNEIGTKELTGQNDGEKIEQYLSSVDIHVKAPYCAAFVYYCFDKVTDSVPIRRTGVANQIYSDAKKRGELVKYAATIDDLIVWKYAKSWSGHIERIYEIHKAGWVLTVGANTSNGKTGSQREGNGVFIRRRNILHPLGRMYVRGLIGFKTEK